jgi:predicted alpha/beta superfamily hydrolase
MCVFLVFYDEERDDERPRQKKEGGKNEARRARSKKKRGHAMTGCAHLVQPLHEHHPVIVSIFHDGIVDVDGQSEPP